MIHEISTYIKKNQIIIFRVIYFTLRNAANGDIIGEAVVFYSNLVADGKVNLKVSQLNVKNVLEICFSIWENEHFLLNFYKPKFLLNLHRRSILQRHIICFILPSFSRFWWDLHSNIVDIIDLAIWKSFVQMKRF